MAVGLRYKIFELGVYECNPEGIIEQVSAPHLRSWTLGTGDLNGHATFELNKDTVEKYFNDRQRFSEIAWMKWDELKKLK